MVGFLVFVEKVTAEFDRNATLSLLALASFPRSNFRGLQKALEGKEQGGDEC
jgi:hypothetical protein